MTKGEPKNSMHFSVESPLHLVKNFQIQKKTGVKDPSKV